MRAPSASVASAPGPVGASRPISLLIVDDSLVVRTIMERMLRAHSEFSVIGSAANVDQALRILGKEKVDIILLDVEMPGTDGLTGLPDLLEQGDGARILMVSALCESGASASVRAMTLGAVDTLLKPSTGSFGVRFESDLMERLLRIGLVPRRPLARGEETSVARERVTLRPPVTGPIECIGIGSSTGGLHALSAFFAALPAAVTMPIIVTQHLPPTFMPYFAAQVAELAHRPCAVARHGERVVHGRVLVAPGDAHLCVVRQGGELVVQLSSRPVANGNMPSVDPMFESLAAAAGSAAIGVVLSGMGRDGAIGAAAITAAGGEIMAQDAPTSVVWGMPGAVARAGLASLVSTPAVLANHITTRLNSRSWT